MAAANSIFKLKVETSEYDQKLANAAKGIRHLADVAHKGGGELTGLEKAELDYIRALGEMETKSRSASGQLRELSGSYKELKVVYDQLNEVEKADEGGKALAASLETLKQRAQEAKTQLDNASKSLNENGQSAQQSSGFLEALASKFTINIDALKLFDMGLKAAGAALDVAKDAFFASETNVDEWGRTIASAEGIYNSFLQSLNSGNFSDFLNNIGQVTQAARDAYNALDELGTRMTIINPERAKLQARQQELRAEIRRNGAESAVGKQALAELKKIEPLLSKSFKTESQMNYTAFEKLVRERLAEGGINLNQRSFQQFMKTFSSDAAFQQMRNNARGSITSESTGNAYNPNATVTRRRVDTRNTEQKLLDLFTDEWRQQYSSYLTASFNAQGAAASNMLGNSRYMKATGAGGTTGGGGGSKGGKTITEEKDDFVEINGLINMAAERVSDLQRRISEAPTESMITELRDQLKDAQAELDRLNGKEVKIQMETGTSITNDAGMSAYITSIKQQLETADYGTSLYNGLSAQLTDMTTLKNLVGESLKAGLGTAMFDAADATGKDFWTRAMEGGVENIDWQAIVDKINEARKAAGLDAISLDFISGSVSTKEKKDGMQESKTVLNAVSQLTSGLKNIGIEIPSEIQSVISVMQGLMQVIEAVNTIIGVTQTTALTANTVAMTSLTAALWANTTSSWFPFANGGVVHAAGGFVTGNTYSGDQIPAMLNAGEVVLNRAQTGNLASQLQGNGFGNARLVGRLKGRDILISIDRELSATGKGQLATWK